MSFQVLWVGEEFSLDLIMSIISWRLVPADLRVKIEKQSAVISSALGGLSRADGERKSMQCPSSCAARKI